MTNREWLFEQMQNMSDDELAKMIIVPTEMEKHICAKEDCVFKECEDCLRYWFKYEYKELIELSDVERVILENIDKEYKWICRDDDEVLAVFSHQPSKMSDEDGFWCRVEGTFDNLECFNHLFQFIKWSDTEPYNIEELLKECEECE